MEAVVDPIPRKTVNRQDAKVASIPRLCLRTRRIQRPPVRHQRCSSGASRGSIPPDVLGASAVQEFGIEMDTRWYSMLAREGGVCP